MIQLTAQMRILVAVRATRLQERHRWSESDLPRGAGVRSTVGNGVRVPKPSGHGDSRAEL